MEKEIKIFLPGLDNQIRFVKRNLELKDKRVLILGGGSEEIVKLFAEETGRETELIVESYNSLLNSRLLLGENTNIKIRLMDFEVTDFDNAEFDLIYTQGAVSNSRRNKIVKEIKRILKPNGFYCVGEVITLNKKVPSFVENIFNATDLVPLFVNDIADYYGERKFKIIAEKDLTFTLGEYYSKSLNKLKKSVENMEQKEKSYYKKLINMISHEAKAYLNEGADEYVGFYALILQKQK
jgi:ubiquinone/menaquinone biosynthesis C-methylase UbiE